MGNRILYLVDKNITIEQEQRETFALGPAQRLRMRRETKENSESVMKTKHCKNLTFVIKFEDRYEVWNNFSIKYKGKIYPYDTYRIKNDGLYVCNSSDDLIQQRWRNVTVQHKQTTPYEHCNVSVDSFYHENYTLYKDFNVLFKPTNQTFTVVDYGVISEHFSICSSKLSLSCNNYLIKINFSEEYDVFNDLSLIYKNRKYDYREYRINNNMIEMCASNHSTVLHIWKTTTTLKKSRLLRSLKCNNFFTLNKWYYIVNKHFTLYYTPTTQYFTRHDYEVIDGNLTVCNETKRPNSFHYTNEDLLMCNDSIINIKYDDEYKVWNNFSILYENKMYSFTEYRALNDSIKICNSTDDFVQNTWKLRNKLVMGNKQSHNCKKIWIFYKPFINISKDFTVYESGTSQYFTRPDYDVRDGKLTVCNETKRPNSFHYTNEDLLMCNDSIINIKYDDEYKVWNNFSILYENKMYSFTEYRALNDSIKICNSTDDFVQNTWKLRNKLVMGNKQSQNCKKIWIFYKPFINISKDFTVYESGTSQYFTRPDYDVRNGKLTVCNETKRPNSFHYTNEDLLMCNDSIINIKYDDEYKVWNNFSILYKNKMYSYTEYRALNDSIKICNSTDNFVKNTWKLRNRWVMGVKQSHNCKKIWIFNKPYYTINKDFTVYESGTSQYFTRHDYDVTDGKLTVCNETKRPNSFHYTNEDLLMCNDSIINIKYDDEYKVWNNFSILYKNKMYSYTEYRALNDSIMICNSTDNFVKNTWKLRNRWVMGVKQSHNCKKIWIFNKPYYTINKDFTVYESGTSQYFTRRDYDVTDGKLTVCNETKRPNSFHYTNEDLLMCNDSIINIKYDDEYKVWNNFSILYENKMYSFTEYRALNDSIKICNSTDNFVKNTWKLRNNWVFSNRIFNSCNRPVIYFPLYLGEYDALKNFTVLIRAIKLLIAKNDYGIFNGIPFLCVNKCVNSTSTINYEDEYRVWNNFSVMYEGQMFHYFEYRVTDNGLQICNSSDRLMKEKWQNLTALEKRGTAYTNCNVHVGGFYHGNYTVYKNFDVFFKPTNQNLTRQDYGVISGYFAICSASLNFSCNKSLLEVKYGEQYEVFKNFSVFYKKKVYDYSEYRFSLNGVKICTSNDVRVQAIWKTQNKWGKSLGAPCDRSYKLNPEEYTVTKRFAIHSTADGQIFNKYKYAVIDDSPFVCQKPERSNYIIADVKIIALPLFALALSFICLVLLLVIYCLLPDLRTLPGLNLMSLCFSYLIWQIYLVVLLSSYSHVGKLSSIPCERLFVITQFITYSILTNAAVNIYHLRQTFCRNVPVKSEKLNKWRKFGKYTVFNWGLPLVVTIVYIVLVNKQALQFNQHATSEKGDVQSSLKFYQSIELADEDTKGYVLKVDPHTLTSGTKNVAPYRRAGHNFLDERKTNTSIKEDEPQSKRFYKRVVLGNEKNNERIYQHITGDCINGRITPSWTTAVDVYGIQGCLILYVSVTFILTAYEIRQKLKAGQSILQKSNVVKHRKSILLLKLSTTTALSYWFPLFLSEMIDFNFDVKIALYTVTLLTGAYIGIAFGFTRRNYQLLRKKYFPARVGPLNNRVAANEFELRRF